MPLSSMKLAIRMVPDPFFDDFLPQLGNLLQDLLMLSLSFFPSFGDMFNAIDKNSSSDKISALLSSRVSSLQRIVQFQFQLFCLPRIRTSFKNPVSLRLLNSRTFPIQLPPGNGTNQQLVKDMNNASFNVARHQMSDVGKLMGDQ